MIFMNLGASWLSWLSGSSSWNTVTHHHYYHHPLDHHDIHESRCLITNTITIYHHESSLIIKNYHWIIMNHDPTIKTAPKYLHEVFLKVHDATWPSTLGIANQWFLKWHDSWNDMVLQVADFYFTPFFRNMLFLFGGDFLRRERRYPLPKFSCGADDQLGFKWF